MAPVPWVRVVLLAVGLAAAWQSPAFAIKNCYDYGIYRLTGTDPNPPSDKSIRASGEADLIKKLQHPRYGYERVAPTPVAKELLPGDVLLIPGHCGYVIGPNLVDHFIQVYGTTLGYKNLKYDAKRLPYRPTDEEGNRVRGGLYPRDTLEEFLHIGLKPAASYQVWRRKPAEKAREVRAKGYAIFQIENWGAKTMFGKPTYGYLTLAPVGYEKNPPLLRSFPGGGTDPNLKAEVKQLGETFETKEEAVKSIAPSLTGFFRPPLARFVLMSTYKDGYVGVNPEIQKLVETKP